jgi:hypothetical protein
MSPWCRAGLLALVVSPSRLWSSLRCWVGVDRPDRVPAVQAGGVGARVDRGIRLNGGRNWVGAQADAERSAFPGSCRAAQVLSAAGVCSPSPRMCQLLWSTICAASLADEVKARADAERTAKRHRQFVRDRLGVKYTPAAVRAVAEAAIRKALQSKDNPANLINVALDKLVRQGYELPGYTTLDAMATSIRSEVNADIFTTVATRPDQMQRARLERLLWVDLATRRSEFRTAVARAAARQLRDLLHRAGHHRRGQRAGRPGPPQRQRRPGHYHPIHHTQHPPARRPGPRPRPTRHSAHHPTRP